MPSAGRCHDTGRSLRRRARRSSRSSGGRDQNERVETSTSSNGGFVAIGTTRTIVRRRRGEESSRYPKIEVGYPQPTISSVHGGHCDGCWPRGGLITRYGAAENDGTGSVQRGLAHRRRRPRVPPPRL